ncbi:hypothetical protein D3C72_296810 [compost metagenome]
MYIIAIGWIYVVFMMAITETSVVAGIMTFLLYGVLPVTIIVYVMGSGQRKRKRQAAEMQRRAELQKSQEVKTDAAERPPEV